ncbi:hypothetical protein PENPOL_c001G09095 [Penicillium polonicum]|uniref:Cytochrome P450 n=1 Tax=Penicillium polonicum TaxID=60169 RepID=A0A1V6P3A4_PENPO|nr:hypothetical protein PENPOL_c001G09095 [Penicillium polonicum]
MANPPAYRKLVDEIRGPFKSYEDLDFQKVGQLTYQNAALEESLRVYLPVPAIIPRVVPKEGALVNGQLVPEKVLCLVPTILPTIPNLFYQSRLVYLREMTGYQRQTLRVRQSDSSSTILTSAL